MSHCWNHKEKSSQAFCKSCRKPYCESCLGLGGKYDVVYCSSCHKQIVSEIARLERITVPILALSIIGGAVLGMLTYQAPESLALRAEFTLCLSLIAIGCVVHFRRLKRWRALQTLSPYKNKPEQKDPVFCAQCCRSFSSSEITLSKSGLPHCTKCRDLLMQERRSDGFWYGCLIVLGAALAAFYFYLFFYLDGSVPLIFAKGIFVASGLAMMIIGIFYLKKLKAT